MTWLGRALSAVLIAGALASPAAADPVGTYTVEGVMPGTGAAYSGTVTVTRSVERYLIVWEIGGREIRGVALGGAFSQGAFMIGPAHPDDLMLAIGFSDGSGFGTATMFLQDGGTYEGFLVRSNGVKTGQEVWTRVN